MVDDNFNTWMYSAIKDMYNYDNHSETTKLNDEIEYFLNKVTVIEDYFDKGNE